MMTTISVSRAGLAALAVLAGTAFLASCKSTETRDAPSATSHAKKAWHCPMHPQIVQDHPGSCPICGMDLVALEKTDATSTDSGESRGAADTAMPTGKTIRVEPSVLQKIGVRTETVESGVLGREVVADAEGVLDDAAEVSVTVRAMGYLEEVASLRAGDKVARGQILAQFYSPELVAAQGDWLSSRRSGDSVAARASLERLESLGFPPASRDAAIQAGKPIRAFPVRAGVSGWMKTRNATTGQSVMAGAELFRLVEGSGALLETRVPVSDAALLEVGDRARITGDGIAPTTARIVSVVPEIDRSARAATLRMTVAKGAAVRVGALYQARFQAREETGFVVPQDAVLHSGRRDIVFLALGEGRFRPAEVRLGPSSGGKTLVRSGIEAGDEVVVSAQFLLDGESRLQSALDQMTNASEGAARHAGHGGE